jgi:hypothetical protein
MSAYPGWRFFPAFAAPPAWVHSVVAVFASNRAEVDSAVDHAKRVEWFEGLLLVGYKRLARLTV